MNIFNKQECIPVGCVPSAAVAISPVGGVFCLGGGSVCLGGGSCLPRKWVCLPRRWVCLENIKCITEHGTNYLEQSIKITGIINFDFSVNHYHAYCLFCLKQTSLKIVFVLWGLSRRTCLPMGGVCVCLGGGCLPRGCVCLGGIHLSPLWTESLTQACENITFPQLRLRMVIKNTKRDDLFDDFIINILCTIIYTD